MASDLKGIKLKYIIHVEQHDHGGYMPKKEREEYDAILHKALVDCTNIRRL